VIRISERAKDPLKSTFVHELTHHLEATGSYGELREYVLSRAGNSVTKDGITLEAYRKRIQDAYAAKGKTIDAAGVDKEIVANYVEINLFNNSQEIARLAKTHRNLVQVIRDWFTDLRVRFRGTAEEKELLRAQRLFEKALRETNVKGYRTSGDGQWMVKKTTDGKTAVIVDDDILKNIDTTTWNKAKKDEAKKTAEIALRKFKYGIDVDGVHYVVNKNARDHYTRSNETERLYRTDKEVFTDKLRAANNADEILSETSGWVNEGLKKKRTDKYVDFRKGKVLIQAGNNQYEATTVVGITQKGEYVFYDVEDINPTSFKTIEEPSSYAVETKFASAMPEDPSGTTVPQTTSPVKSSGQASIDFEGKDLLRASSVRTAEEFRADTKAAVEQQSGEDYNDRLARAVYLAQTEISESSPKTEKFRSNSVLKYVKSVFTKEQLEAEYKNLPNSLEYNEKSGTIENKATAVRTKIDPQTITPEQRAQKPRRGRDIDKWIKEGGTIEIDTEGVWYYTDSDGHCVSYVNGEPDYISAGYAYGAIEFKESLTGNKKTECRRAKEIFKQMGIDVNGCEMHHLSDGKTIVAVRGDIHQKFTHTMK